MFDTATFDKVKPQATLLFALAGAALLAAVVAGPVGGMGAGLAAAGAGLITLAVAILARDLTRRHVAEQTRLAVVALCADLPDASLLVSAGDGRILWRNAAAQAALPDHSLISAILVDSAAQPQHFQRRLHEQASHADEGVAQLPVAGQKFDIRVRKMPADQMLWRFAPVADSVTAIPPAEDIPWLIVDGLGAITRASRAMQGLAGPLPASIAQVFTNDPPTGPGALATVQFKDHPSTWFVTVIARAGDERMFLFLPPEVATDCDSNGTLNLLPVALAKIAADGTIAFANVEAQRLLGLPDAGDVLLSDRLEGLGRPILEWMDELRASRTGRGTEVLRLVRNGTETYVQVSLRSLSTGANGAMLAVMNDATELKSLEAKFTQSQKMQAIGQLAGGVAHDFNNLLTAISGHCELILLRHDRSDVDYPDLMQIQQNTNRAAALVRQLLAFSRKQTLQFETIDLQAALGELVHLLNRLLGEKFSLSLRYADRPIAIRSDRRQLEQVLVNLVVNARDAMPLGGEVVIQTSMRDLPNGLERDRATLPAGTYAVIEVRDQGIGIPKANLGKLFEPFFTTKRQGEGTGLGLSTVYGIVKQMGGFIFIDSEEGVGTTVSLYFKPKDIAEIAPREKPRAVELGGVPLRRSLVLLVEDEAPVRSFAARALQLQGHRVLEADSAEAALKLLADPDIRPDLFVTDVIMPGLDGPGWVAQVRDRHPHTPVVFMSGYAEDGRSAAQARVEKSVFLAKPFSLGDFTATVSAQLKRHSDPV